MRILPLLLLASLGASLPGACSGNLLSTKEQDRCEKALEVLIRSGSGKVRFSVDEQAQARRTVNGQRVMDVTLTYIHSNTRKLFSCFYRPGTTVPVGYVYEGGQPPVVTGGSDRTLAAQFGDGCLVQVEQFRQNLFGMFADCWRRPAVGGRRLR